MSKYVSMKLSLFVPCFTVSQLSTSLDLYKGDATGDTTSKLVGATRKAKKIPSTWFGVIPCKLRVIKMDFWSR